MKENSFIAALALIFIDRCLLAAFGRSVSNHGFPPIAHITAIVTNLLLAEVFMEFPLGGRALEEQRWSNSRYYRVGAYVGAVAIYGAAYLFVPDPKEKTTFVLNLVTGLVILLDGAIIAKLAMYYLFGLMRFFISSQKLAWYWAIGLGILVSYPLYVVSPTHVAAIAFMVGYIFGLYIVKWMAAREYKEYCRIGGMPTQADIERWKRNRK